MSTPLRAAWAIPARTALGVDITSAQGDAPTSTTIPRRNASEKLIANPKTISAISAGIVTSTIGV